MRLRAVLEIGFRRNRVLLIAQLVSGIGDQFGKDDADVGLASALPGWQQLLEAIEEKRPE